MAKDESGSPAQSQMKDSPPTASCWLADRQSSIISDSPHLAKHADDRVCLLSKRLCALSKDGADIPNRSSLVLCLSKHCVMYGIWSAFLDCRQRVCKRYSRGSVSQLEGCNVLPASLLFLYIGNSSLHTNSGLPHTGVHPGLCYNCLGGSLLDRCLPTCPTLCK